MKNKTLLIVFALTLLAVPFSFSQAENINKLIQYQEEQAVFYLQNLSFFVAFVGGLISVLLPCTLAILPAFFAYTFKERKQITKMTLTFFAGFSLTFIILGIFAAAIGSTLTSIQAADTKLMIMIAGIFLIIFGMMTMLGKGFNFIKIDRKTGHDIFGVFSFGILFGLGWSACLGPVLAGILLIAATFGNFIYAGILLFFYSLGLFVPLFLISILFDKYNLTQKPFLKGREFEVNIFKAKFSIHTHKVIAGLLLIASGTIFLIFHGTTKFNSLDPLRTSKFAYILEQQIFQIPFISLIGLVILLIFVSLIVYFLYKHKEI